MREPVFMYSSRVFVESYQVLASSDTIKPLHECTPKQSLSSLSIAFQENTSLSIYFEFIDTMAFQRGQNVLLGIILEFIYSHLNVFNAN